MANASFELTGEQRAAFKTLSSIMKAVAGVLLALAAFTLAEGIITLLRAPRFGVGVAVSALIPVIEGLVTGLLGLIMLSSSTDVVYMADTKYTSIHLMNAFSNLTVFYKSQFFLALFLIVVNITRILVGG